MRVSRILNQQTEVRLAAVVSQWFGDFDYEFSHASRDLSPSLHQWVGQMMFF